MISGPYPFSESIRWNDTTPGIPFCSADRRKRSSFDGVLKTAGELLAMGLAGFLQSFGPGVDGSGVVWSGRMKDATNEKREVTVDRAESSAEFDELCTRLQDVSDDLQTAGSNDVVFSGQVTVATPSYCYIDSIYACKEMLKLNKPLHGPTPSS